MFLNGIVDKISSSNLQGQNILSNIDQSIIYQSYNKLHTKPILRLCHIFQLYYSGK